MLGRYRGNNGQRAILARPGNDVNDPKRTYRQRLAILAALATHAGGWQVDLRRRRATRTGIRDISRNMKIPHWVKNCVMKLNEPIAFYLVRKGYNAKVKWPAAAATALDKTELRQYADDHKEGPGLWKFDHYFEIYDRHFRRFEKMMSTFLRLGCIVVGHWTCGVHILGRRQRFTEWTSNPRAGCTRAITLRYSSVINTIEISGRAFANKSRISTLLLMMRAIKLKIKS